MSTTESALSLAEESNLTRSLGVRSIVFLVVAAAAPLTAAATTIPFVLILSGNPQAAVYFVVATLILIVFSAGYLRMSRHIPDPGALASFIRAGLGRMSGSAASTLAIGTYFSSYIALSAYVGVFASQIVGTVSGWQSPWWLWSFVLIIVVGVLGYREIELSAKVLGVVLVAETLIVLVVDIAIFAQGGEAGVTGAAVSPVAAFDAGAPGLGILFAVLAYVGFEASAVFRGEAKNPNRTIPRATYISVIGIGVFYAFTAWAIVIGVGSSNAVDVAAANPTAIMFDQAARYVSPIVSDIMQMLFIGSLFAAVLALQNIINRYQLSMSAQRLLPRFVGVIHPKFRAPSNASLVQTAILLVAFTVIVIAGLDPIVAIYTPFAGSLAFGIVILMFFTSLSTIVYFARTRQDTSPWHTAIAPAISMIAFAIVGYFSIANIELLTGSPAGSVFVIGYLLFLIIAGSVLYVLSARRRTAKVEG